MVDELNMNLITSLWLIFLIPLLLSYFDFLYQFVKGIREYRYDFLETCKGKSRYQSIFEETSNFETSSESFKYCGFYVGIV